MMTLGCTDGSDYPVRVSDNTTSVDFRNIQSGKQRKAAFISFMLPVVTAEIDYIDSVRDKALELLNKRDKSQRIDKSDRIWLSKMCEQYLSNQDCSIDQIRSEQVSNHIDSLPASLVIAQAALESGWGTSRFSVEANNYFGQWCYTSGCGLVPINRGYGEQHEVKKFEHVSSAVASYFRNINRHQSYIRLREIRANLRRDNKHITASSLANGLVNYSAQRFDYVEKLKAIIRTNNLSKVDEKPFINLASVDKLLAELWSED